MKREKHSLQEAPEESIVESTEKFHGQRVRLIKVEENQGLSVAEYELKRRIGREGVCDCKNFDGDFMECVSVLFDDGMRLPCTSSELQISEGQKLVFGNTQTNTDDVDQAQDFPIYVQASITSVSFAEVVAEMPLADGGRDTDMECLLWPEDGDSSGSWSVARWMTVGDILFFYHTKSAAQRIIRLLKAANEPDNAEWAGVDDQDHVVARLEEQLLIAESYGGTIFACAILKGSASVWSDSELGPRKDRHWKGNIHAKIGDVYIFARPVPDYAFNSFLRIQQGTITPLHGSLFTRLKTLIASANDLPLYLSNAVAGGVGFKDVNKTNWIEISCSPRARFIDEAQFREFLVDYLLDRIKDPKTALHRECFCESEDRHRGYADYCIRVNGRWVSVEAKLNTLLEADILGQIRKYLSVNEFSPNWNCDLGTVIKGPTAAVCMIIDTTGIYFADNDGFIGCEPSKPVWHLREMSDDLILKIRSRLKAII